MLCCCVSWGGQIILCTSFGMWQPVGWIGEINRSEFLLFWSIPVDVKILSLHQSSQSGEFAVTTIHPIGAEDISKTLLYMLSLVYRDKLCCFSVLPGIFLAVQTTSDDSDCSLFLAFRDGGTGVFGRPKKGVTEGGGSDFHGICLERLQKDHIMFVGT